MIASIRHVGNVFLAMLAVLTVLVGYWQVVAGPELASAPGNPRVAQDERRVVRGRILDRKGRVVVESAPDGSRTLHDPSLGPVVGYRSPRYGVTGVERAEDASLAGRTGVASVANAFRALAQVPRVGADVYLTIDPSVQATAATALGSSRGAIVVMDIRSGAILAMVSQPSLDTRNVDERWASLLGDEGKPLINRASQGLYVPGSTFKVVTAAAALDAGIMTPSTTVIDATGETTIDGFRITDAEKPPRASFDFAHAFAWSSNVVFADVALKLGEARLREYSTRFGVGTALPFDLDTSATSLSRTAPMPASLLASTGFGQGELLLSPLQVAVIGAAIARGGDVPRPYIVGEVRERGTDGGMGANVRRTTATTLGVAVSASTAGSMRALLGLAVEEGFSKAAAVPGVRVGGKTGTAQSVPGQPDHAWFVGIAPLDAPRVVVVVLREFGGWGAEAAAPLARPVLERALAATVQ